MNDKNNTAFAYGVNMLRLLLSMNLICEAEYKAVFRLQAEHYGLQKNLCLFS